VRIVSVGKERLAERGLQHSKNKTALKQSIASVKFLAFAIVVMRILAVKYPSGYTIVPLGFFAVFFFIDAPCGLLSGCAVIGE
jgi:predicted transcriptional regulator